MFNIKNVIKYKWYIIFSIMFCVTFEYMIHIYSTKEIKTVTHNMVIDTYKDHQQIKKVECIVDEPVCIRYVVENNGQPENINKVEYNIRERGLSTYNSIVLRITYLLFCWSCSWLIYLYKGE